MPRILQVSSEFTLQNSIRRALSAERIDFQEMRSLLESSQREGTNLDPKLKSEFHERLNQLMKRWAKEPFNLEFVKEVERLVSALSGLGFEADLWKAQNTYYEVLVSILSLSGLEIDAEWASAFQSLGICLGVALPSLPCSMPAPTTAVIEVHIPNDPDRPAATGFPCAV
jgi:hypothetical protein